MIAQKSVPAANGQSVPGYRREREAELRASYVVRRERRIEGGGGGGREGGKRDLFPSLRRSRRRASERTKEERAERGRRRERSTSGVPRGGKPVRAGGQA